jgi:outer membrane protein assembly factor BamB
MKMILLIFSIFVSILLTNCIKDPIILPVPSPICLFNLCDTSKLEIVWEKPISSDTAEWASMSPLLYNNEAIFSIFTFLERRDTIKYYDKKTGKLNKTWADYFPNRVQSMTNQETFLKKEKLLFTSWNDVYCVSAESGKTLWRTQSTNGHPFISVAGDHVYHVFEEDKGGDRIASHLIRKNINSNTLRWDTIHTQKTIDNFEPNHELPTLWLSPQRDSILLFQIRYVNFKEIEKGSKIDLVAYNLNTKKEYFRFENADIYKGGSTTKPFVLNNKVYFPLTISLACYDLIEKKKLWEKDFGSGGHFLRENSFLYVENKFFVKPFNEKLYQLDPNTGAEIWVGNNYGSGLGGSGIVYHNGILYYTCDGDGKIYAIEIATYKKLWSEPSPNKFSNKWNGKRRYDNANIGAGGIAIDSILGYLYTSDYYYHMCLKLPKR